MMAVCRQLMALPFTPVADVNQTYTFIEQVAAENIGEDLHELFAYCRDQWKEYDAIHQEIGNCCGKDMRTDNSVEGFHSRFTRLVGRNHPNVWMLIEMMQKEQRLTSHVMSQMDKGMPMRVGRGTYSVKDETIRTPEARRVSHEVHVYEFPATVGNYLQF